jgi:hypothetical protein
VAGGCARYDLCPRLRSPTGPPRSAAIFTSMLTSRSASSTVSQASGRSPNFSTMASRTANFQFLDLDGTGGRLRVTGHGGSVAR